MKLLDFIMAVDHADQKITITDAKSGRECFSGTALDVLADYSGIDYRKVVGIVVDGDTLKIRTKA